VTDDTPCVRLANLGAADDLSRVIDLLDAYARDPMGAGVVLPEAVKQRLRRDLPYQPGTRVLLAECDGQAVGLATCFIGYSTFRAQPLLNIHDIAVLPAWRGRGLGRLLLDAAAGLGRDLGCCRLTLEVREDNRRARDLYAAAGFAPAACNLFLEKTL
jgi:ribosomal protein S18 acetylase RimI-like enzyme